MDGEGEKRQNQLISDLESNYPLQIPVSSWFFYVYLTKNEKSIQARARNVQMFDSRRFPMGSPFESMELNHLDKLY